MFPPPVFPRPAIAAAPPAEWPAPATGEVSDVVVDDAEVDEDDELDDELPPPED